MTNAKQVWHRYGRAIGPIGTAGRAALGVAFFLVVLLIPEGGALRWYEAALGLTAAPAVLIGWQLARLRWTTEPLDATGPVGFALNFVIGTVLFVNPLTRDAAFLFYGASLFLAAVRGYAGCEVLAVSNWLLRETTRWDVSPSPPWTPWRRKRRLRRDDLIKVFAQGRIA